MELACAAASLEKAGFSVEYVEVREAETLTPVTAEITEPSRILAAARLGRTRLIDNMPIGPAD
jgi:pantoate--beta-alanine ligase